MVTRAEAKYVRISPYKARVVIPLVKGRKVREAEFILRSSNKKAAFLIGKVLKSAVTNAKNKGFSEETLFISRIVANPGPMYKRYRATAFGRAVRIRKRTSHIIVELDSTEAF